MSTLSDVRADAGAGTLLVLVAEDEETSRSALCEILRDGGYRAAGAADGVELLELARMTRPDAIVLDLAMPRLNGMEAASALRSDRATRDVPIIAITASWLADRADVLAAAGFSGAIRKPCTPDRLLNELRRVLEPHRATDEGALPESGPHPWQTSHGGIP